MSVSRRTALRALAVAGATAVTPGTAVAAADRPEKPPDAVGLLYDTTRCIGCKACMVACRDANGLAADDRGYGAGRYDAPTDLNDRAKTVIKLYDDGSTRSFVKQQCMHCVDPACAGACMIGALQKRELGIVTWNASLCIGCRYCQVACPFNVPKYEWATMAPRIVKCELCAHRIAEGDIPACAEACPREAVVYGGHDELLEEAHRRLREHPSRYVAKIYGERDGGGTQVLYLSHVPFENLGLPDLGEDGVPRAQQAVQHGIYRGFVAPAALYAVLGTVMFRNRNGNGRKKRGQPDRDLSGGLPDGEPAS